jgi:hypothetical protein
VWLAHYQIHALVGIPICTSSRDQILGTIQVSFVPEGPLVKETFIVPGPAIPQETGVIGALCKGHFATPHANQNIPRARRVPVNNVQLSHVAGTIKLENAPHASTTSSLFAVGPADVGLSPAASRENGPGEKMFFEAVMV